MSVSRPFVYASVLMAGLLGSSGIAGAEELGPAYYGFYQRNPRSHLVGEWD